MTGSTITSFLPFFPEKSSRQMYSLSSPNTPTSDPLSLPLPASPRQTAFGADVWEEQGHFRTGGRPTTQETRLRWPGGVSAFIPLLLIIVLFALSTVFLVASLFSLPIPPFFPQTLSELSQLGRELQAYSESGLGAKAHVLGVLSATALWKHAWSVPGSVLLNVLAGVLLSPVSATLLMTFLTALGSVLSTLLATPLAPIITQFFPKALAMTRNALEGTDTLTPSSRDKSSTWVRLSVIRLIGVVPWSGINVACGITGVSLFDCFFGACIGTLPWTAVTCQIGDLMQTVVLSTSSVDPRTLTSLLHSPTVILKLVIFTLLSLIPILARNRLKGLISRPAEHQIVTKQVEGSTKHKRWWSQLWRTRAVALTEMNIKDEKIMTTTPL